MPSTTDIPAEQKLCLDNYQSHIQNKYAPNTVENHRCLLTMFAKGVRKEFKDVTRQDIDDYLATLKPLTAEIMKSKLRKFYAWFYKTGKKLPDVVADLECNASAYKPKKTDKDVLTAEQIERFINCMPELQHKALCETLVVAGGRNQEVGSLTLGDVEERDGIVWIHLPWVKNRGGASYRDLPICPISGNPTARYPKYLLQWIANRSNEPKDNPLFISMSLASYGKKLTASGIEGIVRRAGKLIGKPKLHPHLLRHTGASYDGSFLTEQDLCTKYGWVIGSAMPRRYCHTNSKNLAERVKKLSGIRDNAPTFKTCPRCGESNSLNADSCVRCHEILNYDKIKTELEQKKNLEQRLKDMEAKFNALMDSDMIRGFLDTQQRLNRKHEMEAHQHDQEALARGEL
jgi:site-specific recombinase XerD